jgi:hypothetical protein
MAASAADIAKVRRLTAEPGTSGTYSDAELALVIQAYPVSDANGYEVDDDGWTATYDLHAAAADIWDEKAATASSKVDFSADGSSFSASQQQANYHANAQRERAHTRAKSVMPQKWPREWVGMDLEDADPDEGGNINP